MHRAAHCVNASGGFFALTSEGAACCQAQPRRHPARAAAARRWPRRRRRRRCTPTSASGWRRMCRPTCPAPRASSTVRRARRRALRACMGACWAPERRTGPDGEPQEATGLSFSWHACRAHRPAGSTGSPGRSGTPRPRMQRLCPAARLSPARAWQAALSRASTPMDCRPHGAGSGGPPSHPALPKHARERDLRARRRRLRK